MSWAGVDLIPMLDGETKRQAIDRVYAGGRQICIKGDEVWEELVPGIARNSTLVTRLDRQRMLRMADELNACAEWDVIEELRESRGRWPWAITLLCMNGPLIADIYGSHLSMRLPRAPGPKTDHDWALWWKTISHFGRRRYAAFAPDEDRVIATSIRSDIARHRYNWF